MQDLNKIRITSAWADNVLIVGAIESDGDDDEDFDETVLSGSEGEPVIRDTADKKP